MIAILKNQIRAPHISLYNVSHSIYFLPLEKSHLLPFEARIIPCLSCTISCPSMTMMLARNLHIFRNIYAICFDGNTYTNKIMHWNWDFNDKIIEVYGQYFLIDLVFRIWLAEKIKKECNGGYLQEKWLRWTYIQSRAVSCAILQRIRSIYINSIWHMFRFRFSIFENENCIRFHHLLRWIFLVVKLVLSVFPNKSTFFRWLRGFCIVILLTICANIVNFIWNSCSNFPAVFFRIFKASLMSTLSSEQIEDSQFRLALHLDNACRMDDDQFIYIYSFIRP